MDQPYSFWADALSKFQIASQPIQALALIILFAVLLMVVRAARFLIREIAIGIIVRTAIRAKPDDPGVLLFGVYRTPAGRWMAYLLGQGLREFDWKTQLPADIIANEHLAHLFKPPN